jgi:hypothetical protein
MKTVWTTRISGGVQRPLYYAEGENKNRSVKPAPEASIFN